MQHERLLFNNINVLRLPRSRFAERVRRCETGFKINASTGKKGIMPCEECCITAFLVMGIRLLYRYPTYHDSVLKTKEECI